VTRARVPIPAWLSPLLLAVYAVAWGARALGGGLLVFDDHPGQLYRLAHAITLGFAPWRFDPGWWAGYAELQYYPPGFAWLGAAVHRAALGALGAADVYRALLWLVWLLPGAATFVLLRRVTGDAWLALPGAFVALTLSAGCRSGVEEGLRWGLVAARLGWGVLPLLAVSLLRWADGAARAPRAAAVLIGAITLLHPAHVPAAAAMVALAAFQVGPWRRRLLEAAAILALGLGLAAVWLLPLLAHLRMALPLAWQDDAPLALAWRVATQPALLALALLSVVAWRDRALPMLGRARWLLGLPPVMAALIALDALVVEPLGVAWLPADRLMDGLLLALVIAGALGLAALVSPLRRPALGALLAVVLCVPLSWGTPEPGLSLWPRAREWPKRAEVVRGLRIDALWTALRAAPPGRVLFVRSGVPLDWRPEWWRPHSHITALTPLETGRAIVGGTFTHPSPVAGLFYTGSASNRPLTRLAEQLDGVSLFGRPLDALDAGAFDLLAARLGVSAVVALDDDVGRSGFLTENRTFTLGSRIGPFIIFVGAVPVAALPESVGPQRFRVVVGSREADGFTPLPIAYSPLWVARTDGVRRAVRRDELGLLEVSLPRDAATVDLEHRPGAAEWAGVAVGALSCFALVIGSLVRRRA
jgi:hypothetical protein